VTVAVVESWVEAPLRTFVEETKVLLALLLHPSGQVLGQHGFTSAVDVMAACPLAAAIHASSRELGQELDGQPFRELYHAGAERQIFLADVPTVHEHLVFLTVFDAASSLGIVQLYFRELRGRISVDAPAPEPARPALAADFERELHRNLAILFGRAAPGHDTATPPHPPA